MDAEAPLRLLAIGVVIGFNNLAAALALGALGEAGGRSAANRRWRVVFVFGLFEFCIPLVGILLGRTVAEWIEQRVGWLGPLLMAAMGIGILITALRREPHGEEFARKATTWRGLVLLAAGLSLDNLVVGFSLGLRRVEPLLAAAVIALFAVIFTWLGMALGGAARRHWERYAELGAGVLLLALAAAAGLGWI